jgi:hypothetical protein
MPLLVDYTVGFRATVEVQASLADVLRLAGIEEADYLALDDNTRWAVLDSDEVVRVALGLKLGAVGQQIGRQADSLGTTMRPPLVVSMSAAACREAREAARRFLDGE